MTYINYNKSFVTSRYLATGDAITTIAYNFQMGVSTARQIILDVCTAIWDVLAPIYMPSSSEDKWKSIADEFYERWNFPNCIGAIDGKHVMIQCPFNSGSLFYNYKSYFSIVLLAVASVDYRFVMCNNYNNDDGDGSGDHLMNKYSEDVAVLSLILLYWCS